MRSTPGYELTGSDARRAIAATPAQGFVNVPLGDTRRGPPRRLDERRRPGYIDNVRSDRVFPTSGIAVDNCDASRTTTTTGEKTGARAALGIDLNDTWTITPAVMFQKTDANGTFGYDRIVGDLQGRACAARGRRRPLDAGRAHGAGQDRQLGPDLRGRAPQSRGRHHASDYADYSFFYDTCCGYGSYDVRQRRRAHRSRRSSSSAATSTARRATSCAVSSPAENRWRLTVGVFTQRQSAQHLPVVPRRDDLIDDFDVPGNPDTLWLTDQERTDHDDAVFGEFTFDITEKLSATAGVRFFESDNSLKGFFGFGAGFSQRHRRGGLLRGPDPFRRAPCVNLDKTIEGRRQHQAPQRHLARDRRRDAVRHVVRRFPPGRHQSPRHAAALQGGLPHQLRGRLQDRRWAKNRVRINGAVFQDDWDDFQYSFLGAERPHRDPQRRPGAHQGHRGRHRGRGDGWLHALERVLVARREDDGGLLRHHVRRRPERTARS